MAYVNYMEVGKTVLVAGIGVTAAGYIHFMFLEPQFAGQTIMGISTTFLIDAIMALIIGVVTVMYARGGLAQVLGYGVAGAMFGIGLLQQLGVLPFAPTASLRVVSTPTRSNSMARTVSPTPSVGTYRVT